MPQLSGQRGSARMLGVTQMNILAAATGIPPALNRPELALAECAVLGKEHSLFSANIGLPSTLIRRCRQWPTYTTFTSPMVKMLVEQDELRKAGTQGTSEECRQAMGSSRSSGAHTPGRKPSDGSQEAGFTDTTQESSRPNEDSSPLRIARGSPANTEALVFQSSSSSAGPPIKGNKVIFSSKPRFRVLPYGSQMSPSKQKSTACS